MPWPIFIDDFQRHWPTDENIYVDFVRDGGVGDGAAHMGNARWRRLTEDRAGGAKSVFHFDVQGSVAKSTHAGIPWLRFIRLRLGDRAHFWPSTAGTFRLGVPPLLRSIRRCGAAALHARTAQATSVITITARTGNFGHNNVEYGGVRYAIRIGIALQQ